LCLLNYLSTFHNSLWSCVFWHCMLPSSSLTCSSLLVYVFSCLHLLLCSTHFVVVLSFFFMPIPASRFSLTYMRCYPNHNVLAHFFCLTCPIGCDCMLLFICLHFVSVLLFVLLIVFLCAGFLLCLYCSVTYISCYVSLRMCGIMLCLLT